MPKSMRTMGQKQAFENVRVFDLRHFAFSRQMLVFQTGQEKRKAPIRNAAGQVCCSSSVIGRTC